MSATLMASASIWLGLIGFMVLVYAVPVSVALAPRGVKALQQRRKLRQLGLKPRRSAEWSGLPCSVETDGADVIVKFPVAGVSSDALIRHGGVQPSELVPYDLGRFGAEFHVEDLEAPELAALDEPTRRAWLELGELCSTVGLFRGELMLRLRRGSVESMRRALDLGAAIAGRMQAVSTAPEDALGIMVLGEHDSLVRRRALDALAARPMLPAAREEVLQASDELRDADWRVRIAVALKDRERLESSLAWPDLDPSLRRHVDRALADGEPAPKRY